MLIIVAITHYYFERIYLIASFNMQFLHDFLRGYMKIAQKEMSQYLIFL